jgi:tetratricopeptide (TPR) repeat protein
LFSSCSKSDSKEYILKEIDKIINSEEGLTTENTEKLFGLKEKYVLKYDDSISVNFLNELGFYFHQKSEYSKSENYLKRFIERSTHYSENQGHAYVLLAKNYEKIGNYPKAIECIQSALQTEYLPLGGGFADIYYIVEQKMDKNGAEAEDYVLLFNSAKSAQQPQMALAMADSVFTLFKDYDKKPELLFSAANVAWDLMENNQKSEKYFSQLIEEFPNHELSKEAKYILENNYTSKTPEEILDDILKKNKNS